MTTNPESLPTARTANGAELTGSLDFFKAMANPQRLKILGLLATRAAVVEEIAAGLEIGLATVSHHLRVLRQAGLVESRKDQQYRVYALRESRLREMADELTRLESLKAGAGPFPEGEYEAKVMKAFVKRGRLLAIPAQRKKRAVVLDWLLGQFESERRYPEAEVNQILGRFHDDFCTLRREMIITGRMQREQGQYWRLA